MTVPRQVLPGKLLCVTRRCSERRFFLRPDPKMNQLVAYLLALGCEKFGIELLGGVAMSNHYHLTLHDPDGRHPAFTQWFNGLLARAGNHLRRRTDAFWSAEQVNVAELADPEAVLDNLAYLAANPVGARAVRRGSDWPGFRTDPADHLDERPRTVRRPKGFFREESELPEVATLRLRRPPTHAHLSPEAFAAELGKTPSARTTPGRRRQGSRRLRLRRPRHLLSLRHLALSARARRQLPPPTVAPCTAHGRSLRPVAPHTRVQSPIFAP